MEAKQKINRPLSSEASPNSWLSKGDSFYRERKYKEASSCYEKAVEEESENSIAWHNHAQALVMSLQYEKSITSCDKALELNPQNADTWFLKSFAHGVRGEYQEALKSCTKGLELDPSNKMVWCTRGQYFYALGKLEEALESFGTALKMKPENVYFKEVTEKVKKWLQRDGQSLEWANKIMAFLQQGGYQDALATYQESLKVNPRSVVKAFNKDYVLTHLENPEKLIKDFEKTKVIDQPQISLDISQKEFEFGRETRVEIIFSNKGKTSAKNLVFQFSSDVVLKQLELTPGTLQSLKAGDKVTDLDAIPELVPGNKVKKLVSMTPVKVGQIALEAQISYQDTWGEKQSKIMIVWITVFNTSGQLPNIPGYKLMWRLSTSEVANIYIGQKIGEPTKAVIKIMQFNTEQLALINEFMNEIKQCSKLNHSNIVKIFDYGDSPSPWLAMEYLARGTLSRKIGRSEIPESLQIGIKLAEALSYSRNLRLAHRNINPDNILFDEKDNPKLVNWRVSRITQKLRKDFNLVENVNAYYPPEKISSRFGSVDWLSDIYQLGAVLYEMLTGQKPFLEKGQELMNKIENEIPPKPSKINKSVNQDLDDLLLRCLAKSKKERYQNPEELKAEFEKIAFSYKNS
jgi:tetratricopeptide (TPR) repeat protein